MVQIGELAFKTRFDGRELTQGLMSSRQQMSFARKEMEALKTPGQKYAESIDNVNKLIAKYPALEANRLKYMAQSKLAYLEQSEAVRKLTAQEKARMDQLRGSLGIKPPSMGKGDIKPDGKPGMLGGVAGAAGAVGLNPGMLGAGAVAGIAGKSLIAAADSQRTENLLTAMTQSRVVAKGLISDMRDLSKASGIKMSGLQDAAKTMLGFGVETNKVVPSLTRLADIAGGDTERMKGLALAFSQVAALGRLTGEEVNQMVERGFNPLVVMSQTTGESMVSLRKRMSEGGISFAEFEQSVIRATSAGGKFYGNAAAGNQGLAGAFNKISNEVELLSTKFGEKLAPAAETFVKALSGGMAALSPMIDGVGVLANGFKDAADWASKIVPPSVKDAAGGAMAANPMGALSLAPDMVTMFTAKARGLDEGVGMDAADRVRKTLGKGFLSKENNQRIDDFQKSRTEKARAEEEKKLAPQRAKEAAAKVQAEKQQKETQRSSAVGAMTKGMADQMDVEKWNLSNPNLKAGSAEEVKTLQSMNAQERQRVETLQIQSQLVEKLKDDQAQLKKIMDGSVNRGQGEQLDYFKYQNAKVDQQQKFAGIKKEGDAMRERNATPVDRFKSRLGEVSKLQSTGAIDATTALRERMGIQSQMQQQMMTMQPMVPQGLVSDQNAAGARTIQAGSQEASNYMADIAKLSKDASSGKDPQTKELESLTKTNESQMSELKKQTRLLEKMAETSPKKAR